MPAKSAPTPLLAITGLHVRVGEREVLCGVDLDIGPGETHVLLGPNGSGKTTLLNAVIGLPGYEVIRGSIRFKGRDLVGLAIDERARLGIGVAFQRPPAVMGVRLRQLMEVAAGEDSPARSAGPDIESIATDLHLEAMLDRDVNVGFSGGETKRAEMGQLLAQRPELALFDEPESGVDLDNIAVVGGAIARLLHGDASQSTRRAGLIITHTGHILQYVSADVGHVLYDGRIACTGKPLDLIGDITSHGYEGCIECTGCRR